MPLVCTLLLQVLGAKKVALLFLTRAGPPAHDLLWRLWLESAAGLPQQALPTLQARKGAARMGMAGCCLLQAFSQPGGCWLADHS